MTERLVYFVFLVSSIRLTVATKVVRIFNSNQCYLITSNYYKLFPDNKTLEFYGYSFDELSEVSEESLKRLELKDPIDPIPDGNTIAIEDRCKLYDTLTLAKIELLQDSPNLIHNFHKFADLCNPSVTQFQGYFLLMARRLDYKPKVYFNWLNYNNETCMFTLDTNSNRFGIGPGGTSLPMSNVHGEDPRPIKIDDNTIAIATNRKLEPLTPDILPYTSRMWLTYIQIDSETQGLKVLNETRLHPPIFHTGEEKNWTPFLYNGRLHFVQSFKDSDQKFVVLTQSSKDLSKTEVVSSTSNGHIKWDYGQMRGGTPARLFVASNGFCSEWRSYFFGALLFTAIPPFTTLSQSHVPIHQSGWYSGEIEKKWGIEYVYFPMNFFYIDLITADITDDITDSNCSRECMARYNITVSLGIFDREGYVFTLNALQLYHTLAHYKHINLRE